MEGDVAFLFFFAVAGGAVGLEELPGLEFEGSGLGKSQVARGDEIHRSGDEEIAQLEHARNQAMLLVSRVVESMSVLTGV